MMMMMKMLATWALYHLHEGDVEDVGNFRWALQQDDVQKKLKMMMMFHKVKFRWALQQDRLYFNNKIFVFNATTQQVLIFQLFVNCLSKSLKYLS